MGSAGGKWMRVAGIAAVAVIIVFSAETVRADEVTDQILEELELDKIDRSMEDTEVFPEKMDFSKLVESLVQNGTEEMDWSFLLDYVSDLFCYEISAARPLFAELVGISLLFALFGKLLVTKQGYVSELGFFAVYTGIMLLLLQSFSLMQDVVETGIEDVISFMTAFVPTYAASLFIFGNMASAGVFYELAFGLIYLLELCMKCLLLPGISVFVLLLLMDHFFQETKLSKLAKLLEDGIRLLLKTGVAVVAGLGVVQSLVAPAKDRLSASGLYHGLSAIPGVGNSIGAAGEILVGCGIMIKNSLGAAALIVLVVICAAPVIKVFCFYVMYRVTSAFLWPFCDKRIGQCIYDVARGCGIYLRLVVDVLLLFFLTISMIGASTGFIY